MLRKRRIAILASIVIISFFLTIIYLMRVLSTSESHLKSANEIIHEQIHYYYSNLPEFYRSRTTTKDEVVDKFIRNVNDRGSGKDDLEGLWKEVNSWVTKASLVNFTSAKIGRIVHALQTAKVVYADVDSRGTQLKLLLTLEGNQKVVFKPKWYEMDKIIDGPIYAGKDRFGSEILAFYLSVLLNKPLVPLSVKRYLSFKNDVMPVASPLLRQTSFQKRGNVTCIYGKCYYCKREDPICENEQFSLMGAAIVNVEVSFKVHRSPWQRTYKANKQAAWETSADYCRKIVRNKLPKQRIYDLVDAAIFDFLIQNGDRHHYEVMDETVVFIDNGKGLGNAHKTFLDILAPLYQCCMLRRSTWDRLLQLSGGYLTEKLQMMPDIDTIVTREHLDAIEERLLFIYATIEYCKLRNVNK